MLNEIFEIYSRQGESLIGIGIREAALPVPTAIDILNLFINERILVLGEIFISRKIIIFIKHMIIGITREVIYLTVSTKQCIIYLK